MGRELWEIVRADELNEGDTFRYGAFTDTHVIENIHKNCVAVHVNETHRLASLATVFRRVPDTDDPRVLRQVIENLAFDPKWEVRDEIEFMADQIKHWIDQARRELESEGKNG